MTVVVDEPAGRLARAAPLVIPADSGSATMADVRIVPLPAEMDITNVDAVISAVIAAFRNAVTTVVLDMSETRFCDSCGALAIAHAQGAAGAKGVELRLAVRSPAVVRVLQILRLDVAAPIYPDLAAALAGTQGLSCARDGRD